MDLRVSTMRVAPFRCPSCDKEWQDHPGLAWTCEHKENLLQALSDILPYVQPPAPTNAEQAAKYHAAHARAKELVRTP